MANRGRPQRRITPGWWLLVAAAVLCGPTISAEQAPQATSGQASDGPRWTELTAPQRSVLAPLAAEWSRMSAARKTKWLELTALYAKMPADEQQRVQARMAAWAAMTPAERDRTRLSYQESRRLNQRERQLHWEAYTALPPDQRHNLVERIREVHNQSAQGKPVTSALTGPAGNPGVGGGAAAGTIGRPLLSMTPVVPVAPVVVQAKPGATTRLMSQAASAPGPLKVQGPRIAAQPSQVDSRTMLPRSGPQAPASAPAAPKRP